MKLTGLPIVGQAATTIPAQMRLDANEMVGKALETLKSLGLRYGRIQIPTPFEQQSAQYLLALEALETAGCRIVTIAEHLVPGGQGGQPIIIANIHYRAPDALFVGGVQA